MPGLVPGIPDYLGTVPSLGEMAGTNPAMTY